MGVVFSLSQRKYCRPFLSFCFNTCETIINKGRIINAYLLPQNLDFTKREERSYFRFWQLKSPKVLKKNPALDWQLFGVEIDTGKEPSGSEIECARPGAMQHGTAAAAVVSRFFRIPKFLISRKETTPVLFSFS